MFSTRRCSFCSALSAGCIERAGASFPAPVCNIHTTPLTRPSHGGLLTPQILQYAEQLLRQSDLLTEAPLAQLPPDSYAGQFLRELGRQLTSEPQLGQAVT